MDKIIYLIIGERGIGKSFLAEKLGKEIMISDLNEIPQLPQFGELLEEDITPVLTTSLVWASATVIALVQILAQDCGAKVIIIKMSC